jgi:hypothetical protein
MPTQIDSADAGQAGVGHNHVGVAGQGLRQGLASILGLVDFARRETQKVGIHLSRVWIALGDRRERPAWTTNEPARRRVPSFSIVPQRIGVHQVILWSSTSLTLRRVRSD